MRLLHLYRAIFIAHYIYGEILFFDLGLGVSFDFSHT